MAREGVLFSIITPSTGRRPKALQQAINSVARATRFAGLEKGQLEILIGFDGISGKVPSCDYPVHAFNLPRDNDGGSGIRDTLIRLASGNKFIFLDDDNTLKPYTLNLFMRHLDADMVIGRIDTQLAYEQPVLPVQGRDPLVRAGNIDLLNLCMSRRLIVDRCSGWCFRGESHSAFLNIRKWYTHAQSVTVIEEIVGVFDAGRNLDSNALSPRQRSLLDQLAEDRGMTPPLFRAPQPKPASIHPV